VATAKRRLEPGEVLDGEGGYTVWGKLLPAAASLARRALPIGLAHKVRLKRAVAEGEIVSWDDVEYDAGSEAVTIRREMERTFGGGELSGGKSAETPIAADYAPIAADKA
jgi:predicted homoserine dehydrogenase-like protein